MKKSTADHMHRKRRKNNLVWLFALLGILVLFLGTILAFLIFSNLSSKPTETVQEVSAVNVEKDIPETDMGDLIYHEPAAGNVVMQGGFGYVNNELLVTLDSSDSLSALKDYLRTIGGEVVGEIPVTADYQILLPAAHTQEELEQMIEQLKALPYVRRSSLNYAFELENDAISGSSAYYPNDKKWDDWSGNSGNNWNMKAIDAPGAWVYRNQMQPVNVGVIDGIFYPYHEDLKDVFQEMPLGNASAMMNQGLSIWKGKWSGKGHATHVSGIIGADFDNGKGICGVAPNAKLYGVDWSDSPLYRTIDKKKPTFGDGSNLYCMKIAMLYLVVEKQCQVINISQSAFGVEVRCNASNNNDDAINVINKFNEEFASFLKYVRELSKMEFIICKCANNDNNHDLFFSKDADDDFNLPYILYSDYLKYINGEFDSEPNNQDGIEHYAMFYENFQDGTWNDADGIIDAGCAYICEWDDPTDKISQGDSFTDQQLRIIAKDLDVPDDLNVEIRQSPKAYWESAGLWDIYVEITHNGKLVASGSFDVETGEMGRNIYIYTPV